MKVIGKLLCRWKGHLRGKLKSIVGTTDYFECPRCGGMWTRKARKERKRGAKP